MSYTIMTVKTKPRHFYKIVIEFETDRSLACDELEEIAAQATAMVEEPADRDGNDMDVSVKSVETAFAAGTVGDFYQYPPQADWPTIRK